MIFHGVYTTPQIIDSTLSTSSNNAVNGQAVAEYVSHKIANVEDQIANAGGGCSMCREGFITDSSQYKINKSQALIIGQSVKMYIEFETLWDNDGNVLIGTLNEDIPQPDSEITTTATANGQSPVSIKLIGNQITMLSSNHTIARGDTFHATIEYGGESGGGGDEVEIIPAQEWEHFTPNPSINVVVTSSNVVKYGHIITLSFDVRFNASLSLAGEEERILGTLRDFVPKAKQTTSGIFFSNPMSGSAIGPVAIWIYSNSLIFGRQPITFNWGDEIRGSITYICE